MRLSSLLLMLGAVSLLFGSGYSYGEYMGDYTGIPREFEGKNISLYFDYECFCIEEVRVYGTPIIDKIYLPFSYGMGTDFSGSFGINTKGYEFSIGDFSEPSMIYKALADGEITIYLEDDVSIEKEALLIEKEKVVGEIITDADVEIEGKELKIYLEKGDMVQIRFHLVQDSEKNVSLKDALSNAFELRRIGAEAHISSGKFSMVSYNNISIEPLEMREKRAVLKVSSDEYEGKCVYLHLNMNISHIRVLLDGREVKNGSYYDALFSTGNEAVWNLTISDGELVLLVYIPHFSDHTLTIEETGTESVSQPYSGAVPPVFSILGALLISVLAAMILIFRRKDRY